LAYAAWLWLSRAAGRTPEITDAALVALMGCWLLRDACPFLVSFFAYHFEGG